MNRPYRIIILEDLPSDSALIQREVKKKIGSCDFLVMDNKTDFINGLTLFKPDIILSDYCIPGFDWYTAFKLTLNQKPIIPFIVVSGSTNPKIADECLKSGAMDFISKDNIKDLAPAILKVLEQTFSGQPDELGE
jgi:CheY-like chemotaxis protein